MHLYPGGKETVGGVESYSIDPAALENSMAAVMETEMEAMMLQLKGISLQDADKEGLRMLFVAISRGVLGYLQASQPLTVTLPQSETTQVSLDINLNNA